MSRPRPCTRADACARGAQRRKHARTPPPHLFAAVGRLRDDALGLEVFLVDRRLPARLVRPRRHADKASNTSESRECNKKNDPVFFHHEHPTRNLFYLRPNARRYAPPKQSMAARMRLLRAAAHAGARLPQMRPAFGGLYRRASLFSPPAPVSPSPPPPNHLARRETHTRLAFLTVRARHVGRLRPQGPAAVWRARNERFMTAASASRGQVAATRPCCSVARAQ